MFAHEITLKEPHYYDFDCESWHPGHYEVVTMMDFESYFANGIFDVDEEEWDSGDVPRYERFRCEACNDLYDPEDGYLTQYETGDPVWCCGECDTWYTDEDSAVECCK